MSRKAGSGSAGKKTQTTRLPKIQTLAKEISLKLKGGEILALIGPLGSGKTTFTRHLGKALKIRRLITSPTFTIMHSFPFGSVKEGKNKPFTLYHLDLYRTKNFKEVGQLGITEVWGKKNTLTVIEWADKIAKHLPKKAYKIYFEAPVK